jgi:hypothetical protein
LTVSYPDHNWLVPKDRKSYTPQNRWKDINAQRSFMDTLAKKLNIQKPEDWYKVTVKAAKKEGATFIKTIYKDSLIQGKELMFEN